jgi:hypothetical protein
MIRWSAHRETGRGHDQPARRCAADPVSTAPTGTSDPGSGAVSCYSTVPLWSSCVRISIARGRGGGVDRGRHLVGGPVGRERHPRVGRALVVTAVLRVPGRAAAERRRLDALPAPARVEGDAVRMPCEPPLDQRSCCQTATKLVADFGLALTHGSTSALGYSVPGCGARLQLGVNGVGPETVTGGVDTASAPDAARTTIAVPCPPRSPPRFRASPGLLGLASQRDTVQPVTRGTVAQAACNSSAASDVGQASGPPAPGRVRLSREHLPAGVRSIQSVVRRNGREDRDSGLDWYEWTEGSAGHGERESLGLAGLQPR